MGDVVSPYMLVVDSPMSFIMFSRRFSIFCLKTLANWRLSSFSLSLNFFCQSAHDGVCLEYR